MLEEIRKGLLSGLGAVVLTREKIEAICGRLVEEAKLSAEEGQKLADELYNAGQRQWSDLENNLKTTVRKAMAGMDIGSHDDLTVLKNKLSNMEKRLAILESMNRPAREEKPREQRGRSEVQ